MMMHETNTFSPLPTPIESFSRAGALAGPSAIKESEGTNTSLGGFIEVARKAGAEFTVPMAASAHPSGLVTRAAYEQMTTAIVDEVKKGCDAVLLALHGAMVAEHYDDGEGELLNRLRKIAPDVPIAVALDFHTQMTDAMIKGASIITGYRTYPHIDMADTARRSGRTLMRMLAGEVEPLLNKILDAAWEKREGFLFHPEPLSVQVARAKSLDGGPIVMADHGDNTASGGTQDVMSVIEEAMKQGLEDACAGPICDPASVEQMIKAGVGAEVTLELGGKIDMPAMGLKGKPLKVTGKVKAITDGQFVVTGPMATGTTARMGRTAVLDTGKMQIVVSERRAEPYDLGVFTHCGIDPRRKKYVLIKSRQHFRAGFEPIAKHIVMCDGDGCTASDLKLFKYTKVRRPLYPFDLDMRLGRNEA